MHSSYTTNLNFQDPFSSDVTIMTSNLQPKPPLATSSPNSRLQPHPHLHPRPVHSNQLLYSFPLRLRQSNHVVLPSPTEIPPPPHPHNLFHHRLYRQHPAHGDPRCLFQPHCIHYRARTLLGARAFTVSREDFQAEEWQPKSSKHTARGTRGG